VLFFAVVANLQVRFYRKAVRFIYNLMNLLPAVAKFLCSEYIAAE